MRLVINFCDIFLFDGDKAAIVQDVDALGILNPANEVLAYGDSISSEVVHDLWINIKKSKIFSKEKGRKCSYRQSLKCFTWR